MGVLGTFVWDTIHHPDGEGGRPVEQWGGLAYSLCAFAAACPEGWEAVPIARVGRDLADEAFSFLSRFEPPMGKGGIEVVREPNNRVELRYASRAERTERLTGGVPPWTWETLAPRLIGLDALYVNHLSGFEMSLATALRVREGFHGTIYADLHSLFLGEPEDGPRAPRRLPEWERWLGTADVVQMNETELGLLGDGRMRVAEVLAAAGPETRAIVVTRGAAGVAYASREEGTGEMALPIDPLPGDPTGCGDIWGSVAFCALLDGLPLRAAMGRAHAAAAAKLAHGRMEGLSGAIESVLTAYDRER